MSDSANEWLLRIFGLILVMPVGIALRRFFRREREQERERNDAIAEELGSLPHVLGESPEGVANFGFRLVKHDLRDDGSWHLLARGWHGDEVIGFSAAVRGDWRPSTSPDRPTFYVGGTVVMLSEGAESDRFVAALRGAYGVESPAGPMAKAVSFTAISLTGNPKRLGGEPVQLKLFYEGKRDEDRAECYFNVDARCLRLQFHEKDSDYRKAVVRALTSETK